MNICVGLILPVDVLDESLIYTALAVKYSSKLNVFGFAEVLFQSLEIKVNFYALVYMNFRSFVSIFGINPEYTCTRCEIFKQA